MTAWPFALMCLLPILVIAAPTPDAERGAAIFTGQCAICHGQRGEGGRGPSLARPKLRHAADDDALKRLIRRGLAGTGMPATWLNESELVDVASHVRGLARVEQPARLPGDPARGQAVYARAGCNSCHAVRGEGGAFGPDLTGIGARRNAAHLRASLLDPAADVPPDFVLVRLTPLRAGSPAISGARVNEDTFSVQIRDAAGKLHSFWKSELRGVEAQPGRTAMPSYRGKIESAALDDLIAYLASLEEE